MSEEKLKDEKDSLLDNKNWLIVGLGNPGQKYEKTRHNLGFMLIDLLASDFQVQVKRQECRSLIGQTIFDNQKLELVKPQTFMNLSGEAINCLVKKENRIPEKIIVIVDDLALDFGTIRIRSKGSDGGHNGLKDINAQLQTQQYARYRFGVGSAFSKGRQSDYVLGKWSEEELKLLPERLEKSLQIVKSFGTAGLSLTMNSFNRK